MPEQNSQLFEKRHFCLHFRDKNTLSLESKFSEGFYEDPTDNESILIHVMN